MTALRQFASPRRLLLCVALLSACSAGDTIPENIAHNRQALAVAAHLSCRYQKSRPVEAGGRGLWHFWRAPDRTESYDERSGQGETWIHDASGNIFYQRLFFRQKAVLEYNPGDLAAAGVTITWDHLYSIIDPNLLQPGDRRSDAAANGTEHYERTLADGAREHVVWLPDLRLPLRVTHTGADTRLQDELRLLDCSITPPGPHRPVSDEEFASFRIVEFSDLGDMESDPLVRQLASLLGGHHH